MLSKISLSESLSELLIAVYILFQLIVVLLYGEGVRIHFITFYLAGLLFLVLLAVLPQSKFGTAAYMIRKLVPLALLYFFYRIVCFQANAFQIGYSDGLFYEIEKMFFGFTTTFALQSVMEVWLNELSYGLYLSGIVLIGWVFVKLYNKSSPRGFESLYLAIVSGTVLSLILTALMPTQGPRYALDHIYYLDYYGPLMTIAVPRIMASFTSVGAAFPAFYLMLVIVAAYHIWDEGWLYVAFTFMVILAISWGGIYLRYHYLADDLAAMLIAFLVSTFANVFYYIKYREYERENNGALDSAEEGNQAT